MFNAEIQNLLHKSIHSPPMLACDGSLKHDIDELVAAALPKMTLAVVDDPDTSHAFGDLVSRALKGRFSAQHITLPRGVRADDATVEEIRRRTSRCDALVAVGSGSINDLCKYASKLDGKPYIVFPTAASMNGYVSANASITVGEYKKTLPAQMPLAVFCDLSVIAAAPARLTRSGLGDSLARATAQADWLLSHYLLGTAYDDTPFKLLESVEPQLLEEARGLATGHRASVELLLHTLLLSGFGMTIAKGSYPASQGEHMIAHAYGMLKDAPHPPTLHGEEIGVTTLYMAQLQERLLRSKAQIALPVFPREKIAQLFGEENTAEAEKSYMDKQERCRAAHLQDQLTNKWEKAVNHIATVNLPSERIRRALNQANAPDNILPLGWESAAYAEAVNNACYLRDRFTFLDL